MATKDLGLPSAVHLLEQQIERRKAGGQRFSQPPASVEDTFRSARRAPSEQVRQSVRQRPMRVEPPIEVERTRDMSPGKKGNLSPGKSVLPEGSALNRTNQSLSAPPAPGQPPQPQNQFRINVCQRVEPPKDLNAPPRVEEEDPNGRGEQELTGVLGKAEKLGGKSRGQAALDSVSKRQASNTKMKDQELLAFACRRANKTRSEALAYYSMGVLHDNAKEYDKAVLCYEQYLQAARGAGDAKGEQLALNSIGIDWHKMKEYEKAVDVHSQHLQMADIPGKFVAHCNLGLAYAELDESEKASLNHRQALRYAIVMSSLVGESLACGNLGLIGAKKGDIKTAKACMERHLKLATALHDVKAQLDACNLLGSLANDSGQYEEAASYYEQARALSLETGNARLATATKCMIGIAKGNAQFDDYVASQVKE